jgi:virginiamycin A acetyltransferase
MPISVNLYHKWTGQDVTYYKQDSRPFAKIGAFSYTGEIHIYNYQFAMHPDQEDSILEIGRCSSLGHGIDIHIYGDHDYKRITTSPLAPLINYKNYEALIPRQDVRIGNDVWIGHGAVILSGVEIGDGAVIGAMAVVAKNIPPYAVAVGNPARVIKYRFSDEQICALQKIKWWTWPHSKIEANVDMFFSKDIDKFIEIHQNT